MQNGLDKVVIFNIQRSKSVGFEVNTSDDFKEKETRSDDRSVSSELFSNIDLSEQEGTGRPDLLHRKDSGREGSSFHPRIPGSNER